MSSHNTGARPRARTSWRRRLTGLASLLVGTSSLVLLPAGQAFANYPTYSCTDNTVYALGSDTQWQVRKLDSTNGTSSTNGEFDRNRVGGVRYNALALEKAGEFIWAFDRDNNRVARHSVTHTTKTWNMPTNSNAGIVVAGAINPANGVYYYASGGSSWNVYAFDTRTETAIGQVATITGTGLGGNGDFAFDATGTLWIVSNDNATGPGTLARVNGSLPTTAGATSLGISVLTSTPGDNGQYHSMAFDSDGFLVIGTSAPKIMRVNPTSGAIVGSSNLSFAFVDLASCATPSTAQARVDLPEGRYASGDQFKVTLSGNGLSSGNSGTTTGADTGLQDENAEVAGPAVVLPSQSYTIKQTAAGSTSFVNYATTWSCVDGSGSQIASGSGNEGTFTVPSRTGANVTCTFTNKPLIPAIELDKTASAIALGGNGRPDAGDTITFGFKVKNTGNVPLNPVVVHDPKLSGANPNITCPSGSLAVNATVTCTSRSYTLTQADVDNGSITNTATATGTASNGVKVTDDDSTTTPVAAFPAIELDKTASAIDDVDGNGPDAGDKVTYGFKVTNTGNVTLNPVTVHDSKLGGAAPNVTCPTGPLAPGASKTCSPATYTLTQGDVDNGAISNTATATGKAPNGATVNDDDSTSTSIAPAPAILLDKTVGSIDDVDGNGADAGDTLTFGFKVTNTGTVTLNPVTVHDPKLGGSAPNVTCPSGPLAPGASVTCTDAVYTLTQADVDAGFVENTATATGKAGGASVTSDDTTMTTLAPVPAITLVKSASAVDDKDGNGDDAGDTITYSFTVKNTGTVTLDPVTVNDPLLGGSAPTVTCPSGPLAPGASVTCTDAVYTLTQGDIDNGGVDNTATATGTAPGGATVSDDDSTSTPLAGAAAITLDKSASAIDDKDGNGTDAGDTITYTFSVKNTGTVVLDPVTVHDPLFPGVSPNLTCPSGPLAPGATVTCDPMTYVLGKADLDNGSVDNTAVATGTAPDGATVSDDDSTSTKVEPTPVDLVLDKSVSNSSPYGGQSVVYTLSVRNDGGAAAEDVVITDDLPEGVTFVSVEGPCTEASGTVTCTWGSVAGGATKQAKITVTVDSLPAGPDHDHLIDVQKAEAHLDLNPGQTRTLSVSCPSGYLVSDGSGRVDHVDQGTGTLGSVFVTESRATGLDTWQVTATNEATGRAQAKVFAVCVQQTTAANQGHDHQLELGGEVTKTVALGAGSATTTLSCGPGELPARPGYVLDGTAAVVVSYPDGAGGWEFSVERGAGDATSVDLSLGCVESQLSESAGHRHALDLAEVRDQVTVPAGQVTEVTLTCPVGYKGVVAGWDVDPGLVNLGNDPRPISRVFKFYNPTGSDLDAHVWLGCLSTRTAGGNAARTVTNTATVTTTSTDTGSGANTDSAGITVKSGTAPASPAAPKVALKGARKVLAKVECEASECGGTAKLVATKTQKVKGTKIRKGQLLAKGRYSLDEGQKRSVTLKATGKGKKVLKKIRKATLKLGSSTRVVKVR